MPEVLSACLARRIEQVFVVFQDLAAKERRQIALHLTAALNTKALRTTLLVICILSLSLSVIAASSVVAQMNDEYGDGRLSIQQELTVTGPKGVLRGTLTLPVTDTTIPNGTPVVLIVPGSGPTDRDGNSPLGISAAPYALLAKALAERGIPSVRIDKRGMFGSEDAIPDANDVTITAYGDDVLAWTRVIRERLPTIGGDTRCVLPLGHSEGGLVVLAAISRMPAPCGLILVSTPGRPLGTVLRDQLYANPANAPLLTAVDETITTLELSLIHI